MFDPRNLVRIDGIAGLTAGVFVLLHVGRLSNLYDLPNWLVSANGIANLAYGTYSSILASFTKRPLVSIAVLATANLIWGIVCLITAGIFFRSATVFGFAHAVFEGLFVGGLGLLEWRFRLLLCGNLQAHLGKLGD